MVVNHVLTSTFCLLRQSIVKHLFRCAAMLGHTAAKRAQWVVKHDLRKYEFAFVHGFERKSA